MVFRVVGFFIYLALLALALLLVWPEALNLQNQWVFAHVVGLRAIGTAIGIGLAILLAIVSIMKIVRRFCQAAISILLIFVVGNCVVLGFQGYDSMIPNLSNPLALLAPLFPPLAGLQPQPTRPPDAVTALSWNTAGDAPGANAVTTLVLANHADIVVLPETTEALGEAVAVNLRAAGAPMWVHSISYNDAYKALSTVILTSTKLGDYRVTSALAPGPPTNTNTLPTVVAVPVSGNGPTLVATHAVSPRPGELRNWRSDLTWLQGQCQGQNTIMLGDFNATVDHFSGHGTGGGDLGRCKDAGRQAHSAAVGTWPTNLPPVLGAAIDHVLATPNWRVSSYQVITGEDQAGSDHRPIVATLVPTG